MLTIRFVRKSAIKSIKKIFKALDSIEDDGICLFFKDYLINDNEKIEIPPETWETLVVDLKKIWIEIPEEVQDVKVQPLEPPRIIGM